MKTVGIDLAAEPKGTALSEVEWSPGSAKLVQLILGANDQEILVHSEGADKVGIDCALGWPVEFVKFLQQQTNVDSSEFSFEGGINWRRRIAFRETDRRVRAVTGRWPLSVATDRLGMTALRCSGLLSKFRQAGVSVDRSGAGLLVEIYPSATLRLWGFDASGYRNSSEIRARLLEEIRSRAPWLQFGDFLNQLTNSCDAFDSLIAALATRSAALGFFEPPSGEVRNVAEIEGWIALPNRTLEELLTE